MTRKEAIGRIQEHIRIHSKKEPFTPYLDEAFYMAIKALKDRPHGEWIFKVVFPTGYWECSICKKGRLIVRENFCPNCGADMRKEGDNK